MAEAAPLADLLEALKAPQLRKRQEAVVGLLKRFDGKSQETEGEVKKAEAEIRAMLEAKAKDSSIQLTWRLSNPQEWQAKHGALLGAEGLLKARKLSEKYRVRLAVASVLQALAEVDGISVYLKAKKVIFESINRNFTRNSGQAKIKNQAKFLLPTADLLSLVSFEETPQQEKGGGAAKEAKSTAVAATKAPAKSAIAGRDKTAAAATVVKEKEEKGEELSLPSTATVLPTTTGNGAAMGGGLPTLGAAGKHKGLRGSVLKKHGAAASVARRAKIGGQRFALPGAVKGKGDGAAARPTTTTRISKPKELTRWKAELREQMHDTEGWKSLETSFGVLKAIVAGSGTAFSKHVDREILQLIEKASSHTNRFVREIAYKTIAEIAMSCDLETLKKLAKITCLLLAKGLSDNWSQVRYASSIATRHMLLRAQKEGFAEEYLPILLPPMCINRYYVAQGVRIYSQESWKLAMGTRGPDLVAKYISNVVDFYVQQAQADNHAVREAACACITELALKVDRKAVSPKVDVLLETLIDCFKDDSWPVRDAACSDDGDGDGDGDVRAEILIKASLEKSDQQMYSCGSSAPKMKKRDTISAVKEQKDSSTSLGDMANVTQFGVARRLTGKASLEKSDQQMYSCGSLAPKMKKRDTDVQFDARSAGCMDHSFQRPAEPWEISDGALYLLREVSSLAPQLVTRFLPQVIY
eukprot:jgi/Bigna1/70759/fgenesh1_pg.13_\